ncbi:Ferrous iron transport protein B [Moorella glycerini]|uniref:Ferrous iron transport protein B n=1 Tax=Neomoorella stamsii TaxID=1266720 RepID=A0A9X7P5D0_9FIRM|nr:MULTISPECIES: ferrous iron transport protein B [Moorella]PRR71382.1 Ferrous iron transport protein B [Moorella stamsii]CEP66628.1 Ferrous iron transport protein B [Moorella glycerini]CEP68590.1 Ferrous iron transport protein B [Moorella glycerini]
MACHDLNRELNIPAGVRKIVLAGNPNVGKSVFFNAFTGLYVDVSNFPGTTLEISHARVGNDFILDTPGVYGVSSFNEEEKVARDVILAADIVINVVDAVHLDRDLFLTQQIIDMGIPMVVALNMIDEAARQGIKINVEKLEELLGVPVIPTVAIKKQGFEEIKQAVARARKGHSLPELEEMLPLLEKKTRNRAEALLILEGDPFVAARHRVKPMDRQEEIYLARRRRVDAIVAAVVQETNTGASWSTRLSRWMMLPLTGIPLLALTLWTLYEFIGVFVAQTVVGITEEGIMQGYYEPFIRNLIGSWLPPSSIPGALLIGEFGILTMTATYILGLLLPLVLGFYLGLSALEDSGYLPRIAVLVDRVLMRLGLNGRGIIPIILGFGCVTAATITTRLLASQRERRIATFLLAMAIPCSAQLAVITSMLGRLGPGYTFLYVILVASILVLAGTTLNWLLPGKPSDLLIDVPPLRLPQPVNVLKKTATRTRNFIQEATPLFAGGALLIGILQVTGLLDTLQNWLSPLTVNWLQLPKETATAFIMGFVRRDFGAAGLYSLPLTPAQSLVALVTITIFVPCIASALVIFKERGWREGIIIWPTILFLAFLIGGIISRILI